MTSDEIKAAIDRLQVLTDTDIVTALTGEYSWTDKRTREHLIDLLRQADPDSHMILPEDADGVPIHEGDTMEFDSGKRVEVEAVSRGGFFYYTYDGEAKWTDATNKRHYHKPTVEDVLTEMANEVYDDAVNTVRDRDAIVARYTAKLREVMDND